MYLSELLISFSGFLCVCVCVVVGRTFNSAPFPSLSADQTVGGKPAAVGRGLPVRRPRAGFWSFDEHQSRL